ncbi:class I mannose-6-phosphate isomerase [Phycisphaerales bacterium AB-hyl4]|uniref:Class I mannose-6-phosphate isomerase n=1 Tax=Natronomicrosphaera hydrolytica TaxID=3242702 RepID=A0ABV4U512_9BACT
MTEQAIYKLRPNRVRRNYRGGAMLARWDGVGDPVDGACPEDWIASTVEARNPGLPPIDHEGLSTVETSVGVMRLTDLIAAAPQYMLGEAHLRSIGQSVGFLAKLLDAGMRLHIQAHPTAAFAQQHLGSRWGKLEAYVILDVRPSTAGSLLLGFQHCPTPEQWKRIVLEQDMEAMLACFEAIPVQPGELWYVPGGVPHAIGEGLLVMEIMEPSDLVVRCEFEREGIVVPPEARFMGRDPDFALGIFHYEQWSPAEVRDRLCVQPESISASDGCTHQRLFGQAHSSCFEVHRLALDAGAAYTFASDERMRVAIVTTGAGRAAAGDMSLPVHKGERFIVPAGGGELRLQGGDDGLQVIICMPQVGPTDVA